MVTSLSFGQTEIFNAAGGGAYPSVGWSDVNNVTTNNIDRTSYYLVDAGAPSDIITTDVYDLSSYGSATLTLDVASFGSGTHNEAKIEISFDGGSTFTQTETSTTTTGSSYIAGGSFALSTITNQVQIRISNNGVSGRGVRLRNIKLVALGTLPSLTISAPADMTVFTGGTTTATISMSTNNFTVDVLPGVGGTGDGHIHWTLDTNSGGPVAQPMKYDTNDIMLPVVDGSSYVIVMTLVDNSHTPIAPAVTETVNFSVAYPCDLVLGTITTTCETSTAGPANDTYTTTIDFTGGNTSTYIIDTAGNGAVSGDNPNTNATGQIIITGSTEDTDLALTVTGDPMNSSCTIVRNVTSPVCVTVVCHPVGSIIINEIMKNPSAVGDTSGEYFEVYNTTGASIDMQGWVIKDDVSAGETHTIASSVIVPSMGYTVFGVNSNPVTNGGITVNYQYDSVTLGNSGTDGIVIECSSTIIDQVVWGAGFPNSTGVAMELSTNAQTNSANDNGANWANATNDIGAGDFGTPGAVNDNSAPLGIADNKIEGFKIFPNPTNGSFITITTANNTPKNVQVYDMLGKKVIDQEVVTKLNIATLQTGIYIVKVSENNLSVTKRLIVK